MGAIGDLDIGGSEDALEDVRNPTDFAPGRSTVDRIRQRHARRRRYIDLPIPEWDGDVVVRYGRVPKKALIAAGRRNANAARSNAQLLVAACEAIFVLNEDGRLEPAAEADGQGGVVRFDGRLADLFEISATEPVDVCVRMYADDIAIGRHAQRIFAWQTGEDLDSLAPEEVEDDAGEVNAAT